MGISNMSGSTGGYVGVGIIALMDTYGPAYSNLGTFITVRNCCAVLPLALIPLLCPAGSPRSTMADMQNMQKAGAATLEVDDVDTSAIRRSSVELTSLESSTAVRDTGQ